MRRLSLAVVLVAAGFAAARVCAQDESAAGRTPRRTDGPWFGSPLPLGSEPGPAVVVSDRSPRPVSLPPDPQSPELGAPALSADLRAIVDFSKQSRAASEIGSGQLWGRVAGLPSADHTVTWAAEQLRKTGIADAGAHAV